MMTGTMSTSSLKTADEFTWNAARTDRFGRRFNRVKNKRVHNIVVFATKLWTRNALRKDTYFFILKNFIRFIVCPMANAINKKPIFPWTPPNGLCPFSMSQWIKVATPDKKVRIYKQQSMRVGTLSLLNLVNHFSHWKWR